MTLPELLVCHLGVIDYLEALELQERIRARVSATRSRRTADAPAPARVHRGRRSGPGELPMGEDWYRLQGIDVIETDRGGKVTYHGPGQLVGYPIVRVDDVVAYVRTLEQALVAALAEEGVRAARARTRARTTPASGSRTARSPRSASTSRARSPPTGLRSTSRTTCSRSSGWWPAAWTACG